MRWCLTYNKSLIEHWKLWTVILEEYIAHRHMWITRINTTKTEKYKVTSSNTSKGNKMDSQVHSDMWLTAKHILKWVNAQERRKYNENSGWTQENTQVHQIKHQSISYQHKALKIAKICSTTAPNQVNALNTNENTLKRKQDKQTPRRCFKYVFSAKKSNTASDEVSWADFYWKCQETGILWQFAFYFWIL